MPNNIGDKTGEGRGADGKFLPGNPGGPGRPKGAENFATKWRKFVEKMADMEGVDPELLDEELFTVARKKAREGDYQFYRDIQDRVFGKPPQSVDMKMQGDLNINLISYGDSVPDVQEED